MIIPRVPVQHRRLLPDRRLSGPTPWVIAILMMLTLLAAAAGVGLARSANAIGEAMNNNGRVIVTGGKVLHNHPHQLAAELAELVTGRCFGREPFFMLMGGKFMAGLGNGSLAPRFFYPTLV